MAQDSEQSVVTGPSVASRPGSLWIRLRAFYEAHSILGNFLILAPAMVVILLVSIQSTVMEITQRLVIVAATVGLAAACAWVISLSEEGET